MGFVTGLFKRPKAPQITQVTQEATPTPTVDQAAQNAEDELRLRRRKGRSQYQLTQPGSLAAPTVGTKQLTGQ